MVQAGTLFEYLAAFITIILALALSDLLLSFHRLLRARSRVKWRPLPLLLAFWVALTLLTGFFELWVMTQWTQLNYFGLVWQIVLYVPLFLAASAALPDEVPGEGLDLDRFYFAERGYIAALVMIGLVLDVVDETARNWTRIFADPRFFLTEFLPWNLLALACFAAIGWSARKWVHWLAFAILLALAYEGYSVWTIEGAPAAQPRTVAAPALP